MFPSLPTTRTQWAYLALALCGFVAVSLGLLILILYAVSDDENEIAAIRRMRNNLNGVSTRTKHPSGFLCMALHGESGIAGVAPTCPKKTEEMRYGLRNPTSLIFRLCCLMDYKIGRRQCEGLIPCGHTTSQRHCAARDILFFNNETINIEYERRTGSGGWCPLEDEATCCIMDVVENYTRSAWTGLAYKLYHLSTWEKLLFVGSFVGRFVTFIVPFVLMANFINNGMDLVLFF